MSVRSSEVMKEKELHLREFAREGDLRYRQDSSKYVGHLTAQEGFARTRIHAILIYGCRF